VACIPPRPPTRPRNDLADYDDLAGEWWHPDGVFSLLHSLAAARAAVVPLAGRPGARLLDVGCGGGLLAPHVHRLGYEHVGVDLVVSALGVAAAHGVHAARADARALPVADESFDVVVVGELLEHVPGPALVLAEACRALRPGGTLVVDSIARTALARLVVVSLAERIPGAAPKGLHDPRLFVDRREVVAACAAHGVRLELRGLRPRLGQLARALLRHRPAAGEVVPTWSTAVLFQGVGCKRGRPVRAASGGRRSPHGRPT
jgi:2-polyprenyl-6-hydroxyphenyl methylase/3-demethylubiquinone-9 3-methyltransferase